MGHGKVALPFVHAMPPTFTILVALIGQTAHMAMAADRLVGDRASGWYAVQLLPSTVSPIALTPDIFDATYDASGAPLVCSQKQALGLQLDTFPFIAPGSVQQFTLTLVMDVPNSEGLRTWSLMSSSPLQSGFSLSWDGTADSTGVMHFSSPDGLIDFSLPALPRMTHVLSISSRPSGQIALCLNGASVEYTEATLRANPGLEQAGDWISSTHGSLIGLGSSLQLGDVYGGALPATVHSVWLDTRALNCSAAAAQFTALRSPTAARRSLSQKDGQKGDFHAAKASSRPEAGRASTAGSSIKTSADRQRQLVQLALPPTLAVTDQYANQLPVIGAGLLTPGADVFLGDSVTAAWSVSDADGDAISARIIFYGVPQTGCQSAGCGDHTVMQSSSSGSLQLSETVTYQRPGRYIIRMEATDRRGRVVSQDQELLVRKVGDTLRQAVCCRSSGLLMAPQGGRPIHSTVFREPGVMALAASLGWSSEYLQHEDLAAESLFDYGILAPLPSPDGAARLVTCADTRVAGAGSPRVVGLQQGQADTNLGHGKRYMVMPQGYNWAASVPVEQQPACQQHWTDWPSRSPYKQASAYDHRGRPTRYCSFACTPDGTQQLIDTTGSIDRIHEAIAEMSYGRLSYSWNITVTDTVYVPYAAANTVSPFMYTDNAAQGHLQLMGNNMASLYHTILVVAPQPLNLNTGYTAWGAGPSSPLIFVMLCAPQFYYMLHELGHRLGLYHAVIHRVDNGTAIPSDPAGPGIAEDGYTDKLDIMSCCRGDYSAYSRMLLGWIPAAERVDIPFAAVQSARTSAVFGGVGQSSGSSSTDYILWPYDRPESRGKLKVVTIRLDAAQAIVLSYKSLPFWQDTRLGRYYADPTNGQLITDEMRAPLAGLSVEYLQRYTDPTGTPQWSIRGLLDFNLLFRLYPNAVPQGWAQYPPFPQQSAYATLKEGFSWLHEESGVLLVVRRIAGCESLAEVPIHNFSAYAFIGPRGENPGQEAWEASDYTGYASFQCMHLLVRTGITTRPGTLGVQLKVADARSPDGVLDLRAPACGFQHAPRLSLVLPIGAGHEVASVVWRDNANVTFATDVLTAALPPLAILRKSSSAAVQECTESCTSTYQVKVATVLGAQTLITISVQEAALDHYLLNVQYTYYTLGSITTRSEVQYIPTLRAAPASALPTAMQGVSLLGGLDGLSGSSSSMEGFVDNAAARLPLTSCSQQWTITMLLQELPLGESILLMMTDDMTSTANAQPGLSAYRAVATSFTKLMLTWPGGAPLVLNITDNATASALGMHVVMVRDGNRMGLWVNGQGTWLWSDLSCVPSRASITYCDHARQSSGPLVQNTRVLASAVHARFYNYALPPANFAVDLNCATNVSCGSLLLRGWPAEDLGPAAPGTIIGDGTGVPQIAPTLLPTPSTQHYVQVGAWQGCSARCGGGLAHRSVLCFDTTSNTVVPLATCAVSPLPSTVRVCNTLACPTTALQVVASSNASCGAACSSSGSSKNLLVICKSSVGLSLPLSACSSTTGSTDWSQMQVSLPAPRATASSTPVIVGLKDTALGGALLTSCPGSPDSCPPSPTVYWHLSAWSGCSVPCGSGMRTRTASCIQAATLQPVAAKLCARAEGALPDALLSMSCNSAPCKLFTWMVGHWAPCAGEGVLGYTTRTVTCMDSRQLPTDRVRCASSNSTIIQYLDGQPGQPAPAEWRMSPPVTSSTCMMPGTLPACRYDALGMKVPCFGHGECTFNGCKCRGGYGGLLCDVPPSCTTGVHDAANSCCASGVLDSNGHCCASGSTLDGAGACCNATAGVDACGVCGGNGTAVDLQGACCTGQLDQTGTCCSAAVGADECGVCGGDSTSCSISMILAVSSSAAAGGSTMSSTDSAAWQQRLIKQIADTFSLPTDHITWTLTPGGTDASGTSSNTYMLHLQLRYAAAATSPKSSLASFVSSNAYFPAPFAFTLATAAPLLKALIQSAAAGNTSADSNLRITDVVMMERDGVCGNGVCEVGEQSYYGPWDAANSTAVKPLCPMDCPMPFQLCPAPSDIGDSTLSCGGNGYCVLSAGKCSCFDGYTGEDCGQCSAGYSLAHGRCQKGYISGQPLLNLLQDVSLPNSRSKAASSKAAVYAAVTVGSIVFVAVVICVLTWCYLRPAWLLRRRTTRITASPAKLLRAERKGEETDNKGSQSSLSSAMSPAATPVRQRRVHMYVDASMGLAGEGSPPVQASGNRPAAATLLFTSPTPSPRTITPCFTTPRYGSREASADPTQLHTASNSQQPQHHSPYKPSGSSTGAAVDAVTPSSASRRRRGYSNSGFGSTVHGGASRSTAAGAARSIEMSMVHPLLERSIQPALLLASPRLDTSYTASPTDVSPRDPHSQPRPTGAAVVDTLQLASFRPVQTRTHSRSPQAATLRVASLASTPVVETHGPNHGMVVADEQEVYSPTVPAAMHRWRGQP